MDHADPQTAALEHLAAALDPRDHATTLVTGHDRVPYLTVSSRHAQLAEDIYADERSYWWSVGRADRGHRQPAGRRHQDQPRAARHP